MQKAEGESPQTSHCRAGGSPAATPSPPSWHLARLECRPPRLPAPHRVSPLPRKPQGEARPPPLRPEPSGEWHAKNTVTRRTLCNSVAGPRKSPSGAGPSPCLPGSQSPEPCLLPVQHRNPEAIADGWTAPRLPGPGTYRREPPQKPSGPAGLGGAFIRAPSSLRQAAPPPSPPFPRPVPTLLGDSPNLDRSPSPVLPYVTAPLPPQALQASTHPSLPPHSPYS